MLGEYRATLRVETGTQCAGDDQDGQDRREYVRGKGHPAIYQPQVTEIAGDP